MSDPRPEPYSSLSLQQIVCLCAGPCDEEAWREFVARVGKPISLIVMRTAGLWGEYSKSLVEDLVQATYLKLWEGGRALLHDFAAERPEAILAYIKKTAANATHDYLRHRHSQAAGGERQHLSTTDVDPEARLDSHGGEEEIAFKVFLSQVDSHLKQCLDGPDRERDHTIFWLYFRQGMSTQEIAGLPGIGLTSKGVGSVIERLKQAVRQQITGEAEARNATQKANSLLNS